MRTSTTDVRTAPQRPYNAYEYINSITHLQRVRQRYDAAECTSTSYVRTVSHSVYEYITRTASHSVYEYITYTTQQQNSTHCIENVNAMFYITQSRIYNQIIAASMYVSQVSRVSRQTTQASNARALSDVSQLLHSSGRDVTWWRC